MNWWQRFLHRPFLIRLLHWEYWSFSAVYMWIYPIWFVLGLRIRSFFFFSAANPTIKNGGMLMESKKEIYDILPADMYPKTILIPPGLDESEVRERVRKNGFTYPLIAKPDIGGKGRGVKKIESEDELVSYLKKFPLNMLVQDYIVFEEEVGIFYYRYPNEEKGRISGIVGKHFLKVEGDGISTIEELVKKEKRYILQLPSLQSTLGEELSRVLRPGEVQILAPYGNHARGALFLNYSDWADERLVDSIDRICKRIPGFHFGRLDLRYRSLELLKEGKDFSLVEVNGAGSEPTHMYDPKHSLFYAWKEIVRHWIILWRISRQNHKKGFRYMTWSEGIRMFNDSKRYDRELDSFL